MFHVLTSQELDQLLLCGQLKKKRMLFIVPSWYVFNCILRVRLSLCLLALNIRAYDRVVPWQLSLSNLLRACP